MNTLHTFRELSLQVTDCKNVFDVQRWKVRVGKSTSNLNEWKVESLISDMEIHIAQSKMAA
jgi:hypothetical protein